MWKTPSMCNSDRCSTLQTPLITDKQFKRHTHSLQSILAFKKASFQVDLRETCVYLCRLESPSPNTRPLYSASHWPLTSTSHTHTHTRMNAWKRNAWGIHFRFSSGDASPHLHTHVYRDSSSDGERLRKWAFKGQVFSSLLFNTTVKTRVRESSALCVPTTTWCSHTSAVIREEHQKTTH